MIQHIPGAPDGVLAFRAVGTVTARDYDLVMAPAVAAISARGAGIRLVYECGLEFGGYTPGALWAEVRLGFRHLLKWERYAIVSKHERLADMVRGCRLFLPPMVMLFPISERTLALDWAAG